VGRVANPNEILLFHNRKSGTSRKKRTDGTDDMEDSTIIHENIDDTTVGEIIRSLLANSKDKALDVIPEVELSEALQDFVEKDSKSAISDTITRVLKETKQDVLNDESLVLTDADTIRDRIRSRTMLVNAAKEASSQAPTEQNREQPDPRELSPIPDNAVVTNDTQLSDDDDEEFLKEPPMVKLESSTIRKRRNSSPVRVKSEKAPTPRSARQLGKRTVKNEVSPPPAPKKTRRASTTRAKSPVKKESPAKRPKREANAIISLSDSDDEPVVKTTPATRRKWGGRK